MTALPLAASPLLDAARASLRAAEAPAAPLIDSTLRVSGLTCAACAGIIENALRDVQGVVHASVNAGSLLASIRHDAARADTPTLIAAVRRAGYDAAPDTLPDARRLRSAESRSALWRLFVAGFCAMQVMMLATPVYLAAPGEIEPDLLRLLAWGGWLLSLPVLLFSAAPFLRGAWRSLRTRRIGMDVPVALGIVVTFVASSGATFQPGGPFGAEVYFDSLTMFVSFLLLGRWFEMRLRHRAAETLEAATGELPETAWRVGIDGRIEEVASAALRVGDRVRVPVGQAFPADGVVIEGHSEVDEGLLSGESKPVRKSPGANLLGGSMNLSAPLVMRIERCGAESRYAGIVALMREAATQRPDAARWADRWAAPFLWAVLLLAACAAAAWSVIDPPRALWVAVAVLIVTCPCALSLATPSALLAAATALARRGVLLRNIGALEALAGIQRVFLDKTGTLTTRKVELARIDRRVSGDAPSDAQLLETAASLAAWSTHPLARALCDAAASRNGAKPTDAQPQWTEVREQPGAGLEANDTSGQSWRLGAARWVAQAPVLADEAGLSVDFGRAGELLARFEFTETLAEDSEPALAALRADGIAITLLSGDSPQRVRRLAHRLGLAQSQAIGAATPERKLLEVQRAQAHGERVGMIGDGINDAPVLARADVSLAMGEGALLARANADAVIVSNRLADVVHARVLAQRTLRVIRQNIAWAAGYNALCVPLALAGALPPWAAGLGMAASSLLVVGNSMRLQR